MKLFEKPGYETIIGDGRHLTEYMKTCKNEEYTYENIKSMLKYFHR